jgi:hypothetical protein
MSEINLVALRKLLVRDLPGVAERERPASKMSLR